MFKYFEERIPNDNFSPNIILAFRKEVEEEMLKMGASIEELKLIQEGSIRNALRESCTPKDVALAILE